MLKLSDTIRLAGVSHGEAQQNIKRFGCPDIGSYALIREAENPHDPNAIRVAIADWFMGYIPAPVAKVLAPMIDAGRTFVAMFVCLNKAPGQPLVGLTIRIVETTRSQ
jgi:hypothetical protein